MSLPYFSLIIIGVNGNKGKGNDIEVNFFDGNGDSGMDLPHFGVSDFFEDPNGNISHLIGDGHVNSD